MVRHPLRDPQAQPPAAVCRRCLGEIYREECSFLWEGRWLCPDCFRAAVLGLLDTSPTLLAQDLGVEIRRHGAGEEGRP